MTHEIAVRNADPRVTRPNAERLARLIGLLSRYWVDPDMAADDMEDRRLAISKAYLVNHLGLVMFIESRVKEGLRPLQIHHLPKQDHRLVERAVALLTEHEVNKGVAAALQALTNQHPFPNGAVPEKPGWTRDDARVMGIKRKSRMGDGRSMKEVALEMISDHWVSVREWEKLTSSTRLPAIIEDLEKDGYEIAVEMRANEAGAKKPFAEYHYFADPGAHAAWKQEQARKEYVRAQAEAEAEERRTAAAAGAARQKVLDGAARRSRTGPRSLATTPHAGGSQFGGWVKGRGQPGQSGGAPKQQLFRAPSAPPVAVQGRLNELQRRVTPKVEVESPEGVPATELNLRFPHARSTDVVEHGGLRYLRRFHPGKEGDAVVRWETSWEPASQQ